MLWKYEPAPYFCNAIKITMSHEPQEQTSKDLGKNWVNTSRFLFYLKITCILAFVLGGCYRLYKQGYKGKPDIEIQGSTKYQPEYK